jgi:uncharacterized protein (DUF885 family)
MQSRRDLLLSAAALGAMTALPRAAQAATPTGEAAKMYALFDDAMDSTLRDAPTLTSSLGLDKGTLAWTKSKLGDLSLTSIAEGKTKTAHQLAQLRKIDRTKISGVDAITYDTVAFTLEVQDEGNRRFDYGGGGSGAPYMLTQLTGAYQSIPDFMDNQHSIETKADADAYLSRMEGFAVLLDQEAEVVRHDADLGVIAPDFAIDKALVQYRAMLGTAPSETTLVSSLVRRTKEKSIAGDWAKQALGLYADRIQPALQRQVDLLTAQRSKAVHDAGCWRLPDGEAYY